MQHRNHYWNNVHFDVLISKVVKNAFLKSTTIEINLKSNSNSNSLFPEDNKSYRTKQWHMNIRSYVANEQRQTVYTQYTYKYIRTHTYIHITHHTHHIHRHTIQIRLHLRSKPCLINFPRLLRSLFVLKSWTNFKKEGFLNKSTS